MNRNSLIETAGRAMHMAVRFTLNQGNSSPMMQELHLAGMISESRKAVEHIQSFGFTATPLPRDSSGDDQGGDQGGGGGDGLNKQPQGPAAEGIALFLGGQRNHPVVIGIDDRRHRPMGLKPGENAQYDDIGQMTLLRRAFTAILSLDSKDEKTGKMVERFVSLRHVQKEKQKRPNQQGQGGSGGSGASAQQTAADGGQQQQQQDDYKHEGQSVNTEVRCTKSRIEFRVGDAVVGYYDAGSKTWHLEGDVVEFKGSKKISSQCDERVETVGKTFLGLDKTDEDGAAVETVLGPAKKTKAKVA